jgi:flagellar assembly protein FliH
MAAEPYALPDLAAAGEGGEGTPAVAQLHEEASARGYEEGLARARRDLEAALAALARAAGALADQEQELLAQLERRAAELALAVAEKIVGEVLGLQPDRVGAVVASALRRVSAEDRVVVAVSPDDLAIVRSLEGELASQLASHSRLEIVPDRRVERGGCVVSTRVGEIDARIGEQLARAGEIVREALAGPSDHDRG